MKYLLLWSTVALFAGVSVRGEVTPLNQSLPEEQEITIACELTVPPKLSDIPVFRLTKECETAKGDYHYNLWLPKGYHADTQRRWPCLFIASARGKAKMGNMAEWLKANGYIVVMLVESRNGPWEPIVGNFVAAHDDLVKRVRILEGMKMATGMSGGARASSIFVQIRPGFSGLILQGAGAAFEEKTGKYHLDKMKRNSALHTVITMGKEDNNAVEVDRMKAGLGTSRLDVLMFDGGHMWAPQDLFENAIVWIERNLFTKGLVPRDAHPELIARLKSQASKRK
jgi:hypothetical protein